MILLVEDEMSLAQGLADLLRLKGHPVRHVTRIDQARKVFAQQRFQLVILDAGLPDGSGFDLLQQIRSSDEKTMVLMLTARNGEADRVLGFELGADDYLCKPFSMAELLGRVGALLRRHGSGAQVGVLRFGSLRVDLDRFQIDGTTLPARAFRLLRALAEQQGQVMTTQDLMDRVWSPEEPTALKTLQNLVVKVRQAIEPDPESPRYLITVHGQGYRLDA